MRAVKRSRRGKEVQKRAQCSAGEFCTAQRVFSVTRRYHAAAQTDLRAGVADAVTMSPSVLRACDVERANAAHARPTRQFFRVRNFRHSIFRCSPRHAIFRCQSTQPSFFVDARMVRVLCVRDAYALLPHAVFRDADDIILPAAFASRLNCRAYAQNLTPLPRPRYWFRHYRPRPPACFHCSIACLIFTFSFSLSAPRRGGRKRRRFARARKIAKWRVPAMKEPYFHITAQHDAPSICAAAAQHSRHTDRSRHHIVNANQRHCAIFDDGTRSVHCCRV